MTTVYAHIFLEEAEKRHLSENLFDNTLTYAQDIPEREQHEHFLKAEVVFGNVPAPWLSDTKKLRWLQLESVGFGEYQTIPVPDDLQITNLRGMFSPPVAETVMAGILMLYRGLHTLSRYQSERQWVGAELRPALRTLQDARVVIVGGGSIGQAVKDRLLPFGAYVLMMDSYQEGADLRSWSALDDELPRTDIVISCLPETQETIGQFGADRLAKLKPSALLVNVGRGSLIDEAALVDCLQQKALGGCVLDVTRHEPLPASSPLWELPNVVLTQHTGGGSGDELMNKVNVFLNNWQRFERGEALENVVNLTQGY